MAEGPSNRGERTQAAILAAAETLFLERGFARASMDAIAGLAGVTKQTVYSYAGSKEALFLDVVDRMTSGAGDTLAQMVPQPADDLPPEILLTRFAEQQLQIVVTPRLMQIRRMVIGEMNRYPELGVLLHRRGPARSVGKLAAVLSRYAERGVLRVEDPQGAASFFNWLIMGKPVSDAMLLGDRSIPNDEEKKAHAKECVRIFMAAFKPASSR